MGWFNTLITQPLGYIIKLIYDIVGNYGVSIILFTIITKIILLPLGIKQQKSMMKTQKVTPLVAELQKKYKNDKEKLNEETMKLYKQYDINPLGGCLPLLIQFPILIGLIQVIYKPITYILRQDINVLMQQVPNIPAKGLVEIFVANELNLINFNFLGIDLSAIPSYLKPSILWIIPLLSAAATYFSGYISQQMNKNGVADEKTQQMNSTMTTMFPIMTLVFTFTMPVAAALYWFMSSLTQTVQQYVMNKLIKIDDMEIKEGGQKNGKHNKKR